MLCSFNCFQGIHSSHIRVIFPELVYSKQRMRLFAGIIYNGCIRIRVVASFVCAGREYWLPIMWKKILLYEVLSRCCFWRVHYVACIVLCGQPVLRLYVCRKFVLYRMSDLISHLSSVLILYHVSICTFIHTHSLSYIIQHAFITRTCSIVANSSSCRLISVALSLTSKPSVLLGSCALPAWTSWPSTAKVQASLCRRISYPQTLLSLYMPMLYFPKPFFNI